MAAREVLGRNPNSKTRPYWTQLDTKPIGPKLVRSTLAGRIYLTILADSEQIWM